MSAITSKKYILLNAFDGYIKHLSNTPSSRNIPETSELTSMARSPDEEANTFGLQDGLLDIMTQIFALQLDANESGGLDPELVLDAVATWEDLNSKHHWHHGPLEFHQLHSSCVYALFVWLYLVVHPRATGDERVQTAVRDGLEIAGNIWEDENLPFLLIPAFCLGSAALSQEDRHNSTTLFQRLQGNCLAIEIDFYQGIVAEKWRHLHSGSM